MNGKFKIFCRRQPLVECLVLQFSFVLSAQAVSPIFAIISKPATDSNRTTLVSSYVKWLEGAGARVVPIRYGSPQCEVEFLMDHVAGLLLPGGSEGTDPTIGFGKFAYTVFKLALNRDIPIWGTCQGHEQILRFICYDAGEPNPMKDFPSYHPLPLSFAESANSSTLYNSMPQNLKHSLSTSNLTINLHSFGIGTVAFHASKALSQQFDLVATSMDVNNNDFVSLTQHKTRSITTAQFHVEKNAYEFQEGHYDSMDNSGAALPHSPEGIYAGFFFASWLVNEARKQPFHWKSAQLEDWIIWNWPVEYSHKDSNTAWEQQYVFPPQNQSSSCPMKHMGVMHL